MTKEFNITGTCYPESHYMVNLDSRLAQIKQMIDAGKYFSINKGRQYGKTTTLVALEEYLNTEYFVISLDFQGLSDLDFENENNFVSAFSRELLDLDIENDQLEIFRSDKQNHYSLSDLFSALRDVCKQSEKPVVLIIDEVDSASNNQVFIDFLSQLRSFYLKRQKRPTFQSVILAGVHDIRNLRLKIRPDSEHKHNSPWNIATNFDVDMSFSVSDIAGMLTEYEADFRTGMNISEISQLIYDYTSGYPVLVSSFCKLMDEEVAGTENFPTKAQAWTKSGFLKAEKMIYDANSSLLGSLFNKLEDNAQLRTLLYKMLFTGIFTGIKTPYNQYDAVIGMAVMYGFLKKEDENAVIANRIFGLSLFSVGNML